MSDETKHKSPLEIIGDQICECLPEHLRNDEQFAYGLGKMCGLAAGWILGQKIIELLFSEGDDK